MIPIVTPQELAAELQTENAPKLLDVRESNELAVAKIDGVVHIPLGQLPVRFGELDPEADWVVICQVGVRSGHATQFLLGLGFKRVRNLATGMNGWARL